MNLKPGRCGRFQRLDGGRARSSKVWRIALVGMMCVGPIVPARGAGRSEGEARREGSARVDVSDKSDGVVGQWEGAAALALWIGAGDGVGPADAVHLAAAWERAGGVNVAVLTGITVRADAAVAALLRMRARLQTGDVAVVGYSGPAAAPSEGGRGFAWSGLEGEPEVFALPATVGKVLDASGAVAVVIQIAAGRARAGLAHAAAAATTDGITMVWTAGTLDRPAEAWFGRTRAADALVRELERLRERQWEGTVEAWLKNAMRRCSLESAGRTLCDVAIGGVAEPGTWPMRGPVRSACEPVNATGEALERLAALLESAAPGPPGAGDGAAWDAARIVARDAQWLRLAEWIEEAMVRLQPGAPSAERFDEAYASAVTAWESGRLDEAERRIDLFVRQPGAPASLRALMADLRWAKGDATGAVAMARAVLSPNGSEEAPGLDDPRAVFHASRVLGLFAGRGGDVADAERRLRAAVAAGLDERVRAPRALAEARCAFAQALRRQGNPEAAIAEAEAALALARADAAARSEVPLVLWELGEAHAAAGHVPAAIALLREASDLWAEARGAPPPLPVVLRLTSALIETGETEEAIRRLQFALNGPGAMSAPVSERVTAQRLLSLAWNRRGERVASLFHAQQAWREAASEPGVSAPDLAMLHADLAALHFAVGDVARAAEFAERSVAEWGRATSTNRESLAATWVLLGEARLRLNHHVEAAVAWSNAAAMMADLGVDHRAQWVRARTRETGAWVEAGEAVPALEASEVVVQLLDLFAEGLPPRLRADAWLQRARALEVAGRHEEADAAYDRALAAIEGAAADAADAVLRAEIAVRCAALRAARGRLFGAQTALAAAGKLPEGLGRELISTARRLRAQLRDATQPHGPITTVADMMAIQVLEMEYRARGARGPAADAATTGRDNGGS